MELLDALNRREPRYLTVTHHGAGQYELRHTPSSARHPFILTSASED